MDIRVFPWRSFEDAVIEVVYQLRLFGIYSRGLERVPKHRRHILVVSDTSWFRHGTTATPQQNQSQDRDAHAFPPHGENLDLSIRSSGLDHLSGKCHGAAWAVCDML
jgi:hypothetical protein